MAKNTGSPVHLPANPPGKMPASEGQGAHSTANKHVPSPRPVPKG